MGGGGGLRSTGEFWGGVGWGEQLGRDNDSRCWGWKCKGIVELDGVGGENSWVEDVTVSDLDGVGVVV